MNRYLKPTSGDLCYSDDRIGRWICSFLTSVCYSIHRPHFFHPAAYHAHSSPADASCVCLSPVQHFLQCFFFFLYDHHHYSCKITFDVLPGLPFGSWSVANHHLLSHVNAMVLVHIVLSIDLSFSLSCCNVNSVFIAEFLAAWFALFVGVATTGWFLEPLNVGFSHIPISFPG